jgi:hypothetical protein
MQYENVPDVIGLGTTMQGQHEHELRLVGELSVHGVREHSIGRTYTTPSNSGCHNEQHGILVGLQSHVHLQSTYHNASSLPTTASSLVVTSLASQPPRISS